MFHKTKEDEIKKVAHYDVKYTSIRNVSSAITDSIEVVETANNLAAKSSLPTNKASVELGIPTTGTFSQQRKPSVGPEILLAYIGFTRNYKILSTRALSTKHADTFLCLQSCTLACKMYIPKRYLVTILAFFGFFLQFLIELNISIAIVEMTSNQTVSNGNETKIIPAEFNWTSVESGVIISASSVGSIFAFLSGPLVHKVGGARIMGTMFMSMAIIELSSPFLVVTNVYLFIMGRTFLGFCKGVSQAGFIDTFARWSPPEERTRLIAVAFTGHLLSGALNYPISGYIAYTLGWRAILYSTGTVTLVWSIIWLTLVRNSPADDHILISDAEKSYLKNNNIPSEKTVIPWKKILTSKQVYALLNEFFCAAWCSSFVSKCLPLYIKDTYNANIRDIGLLAGIPMLCSVIAVPFAAFTADYLRLGVFTPGQVHRVFISGGQIFTLIFLLVSIIWRKFVLSMICFCLIRVAYSFANTSYQVIVIDMGGQYAGVLKSMVVTCFSLGHFLNPVVLGYMVPKHTAAEWNWCFIFLSCISIYGIFVFLRVGGGDHQAWAESPKPEDGKSSTSRGVVCQKPINAYQA